MNQDCQKSDWEIHRNVCMGSDCRCEGSGMGSVMDRETKKFVKIRIIDNGQQIDCYRISLELVQTYSDLITFIKNKNIGNIEGIYFITNVLDKSGKLRIINNEMYEQIHDRPEGERYDIEVVVKK